MSILRCVFVTLLLFVFVNNANADHAAGADLSYICLGQNNYQITYRLVVDCDGLSDGTIYDPYIYDKEIIIENSDGINVFYGTMPYAGVSNEIPVNCTDASTRCTDISSSISGYRIYSWTIEILLPNIVDLYYIGIGEQDRDQSDFADSDGTTLTTRAIINTAFCNSSPQFNLDPKIYACVGQLNYHNPGITEPDGDQYYVEQSCPHSGTIIGAISYDAGLSCFQPMPSSPPFEINSGSGIITYTPTVLCSTFAAIRVHEIRDGAVIGWIEQEFRIVASICTNQPPLIAGVDGTSAYQITAVFDGGQLCFDIPVSDPNGDDVTLDWDQGISGATVSFTGQGTNNPIAHFCWTPENVIGCNLSRPFNIIAYDDNCPYRGISQQQFNIVMDDQPCAEFLYFKNRGNAVNLPLPPLAVASNTIKTGAYITEISVPDGPVRVEDGQFIQFRAGNLIEIEDGFQVIGTGILNCKAGAGINVETGVDFLYGSKIDLAIDEVYCLEDCFDDHPFQVKLVQDYACYDSDNHFSNAVILLDIAGGFPPYSYSWYIDNEFVINNGNAFYLYPMITEDNELHTFQVTVSDAIGQSTEFDGNFRGQKSFYEPLWHGVNGGLQDPDDKGLNFEVYAVNNVMGIPSVPSWNHTHLSGSK